MRLNPAPVNFSKNVVYNTIQHFVSSTPTTEQLEARKSQIQTVLDNKSSVEKLVNNIDKDINILETGRIIGIDTIGSTLRYSFLQNRLELPKPSPLLNTVNSNITRLPLEIGNRSNII